MENPAYGDNRLPLFILAHHVQYWVTMQFYVGVRVQSLQIGIVCSAKLNIHEMCRSCTYINCAITCAVVENIAYLESSGLTAEMKSPLVRLLVPSGLDQQRF